jgi:hypothetical protein
MKLILNKILLMSCVGLLLVSSCKKDETKVVAIQNVKPGQLNASATAMVLTKADAEKPAITFNFAKPDFGFNAAVTNTLQLDVKGNNFSKAKEVAFDAGVLTKTFSTIDFNALLLSMMLPTGVNTQIEARLKSQFTGTSESPVYSSIVNLTVNPYALISFLYAPGAYQGWNPSTADSLRSATSNGIYTGILSFTPGNLGFKVLTKKAWGPPEYGKGTGAGTIAIGGGDLFAPSAGTFDVTVNTNDNTILFVPLVWSLIGNAPAGSNWSNDVDMVYNSANQTWSVTSTMAVGEFKFRKNHDWGTNFGDKTGDFILDTENDNNIRITSAGSYRVVLNLITNTYSVTKL